MLVVAIIGILASVAIPLLGGIMKRSKTTEAKSCLGEIRVLQEAYFVENDAYLGCPPMQELPPGLHTDDDADKDNMSPIGFHPKGVTRYTYTVDAADSTSFLASGEGNIDEDVPTDRWTINERAILSHGQID
jgi:type IV pilus assembly protein PilA